jgi:hypothetical protein
MVRKWWRHLQSRIDLIENLIGAEVAAASNIRTARIRTGIAIIERRLENI